MRHMRPINRKAVRIDDYVAAQMDDVVALEDKKPPVRPHIPMACSLMFTPGWEVDAAGGTAGLCQPVERDIYDCFMSCYWPAQVPDHLNNAKDWATKCATAAKDWRNLDLIFP